MGGLIVATILTLLFRPALFMPLWFRKSARRACAATGLCAFDRSMTRQ
jgi:hypothetical protein